jgi:hypothetical protein
VFGYFVLIWLIFVFYDRPPPQMAMSEGTIAGKRSARIGNIVSDFNDQNLG